MSTPPSPQPPAWLRYLTWVPLLLYFLLKYVVIGADNITGRQSMLLLAFIVVAEIGLWAYRRKFTRRPNDDADETDA